MLWGFYGSVLRNVVGGAIAFLISQRGRLKKKVWRILVYNYKLSEYNSVAQTGIMSGFNNPFKYIQVVCNSITEKFFRTPGSETKHFEHFFVVK